MARSKPKSPRDGDKRFDHWFFEWEDANTRLHRALRLGARHLRDAREAAYRVADAYLGMVKHCREKLLAYCAEKHMTIEEWLAESLAPYETAFGEDRRDIFAAIERGVSAKQFAQGGAIMYFACRRSQKQPRANDADGASAPTAAALPEPTADTPVEQREARWQDRHLPCREDHRA